MTGAGRWREKPNIVPWPPVIYAAATVAGFALGRLLPFDPGHWHGPLSQVAGVVAMATGFGFDIAAMATMRSARANILPNRPATALVSSGPFSISRNPIYLGNTLAVGGLALVAGNFWFLPAALAAALAVRKLAIDREEQHLAARFGDAWLAYAAKTPRWFRFR